MATIIIKVFITSQIYVGASGRENERGKYM
jgi:hypothetical protein